MVKKGEGLKIKEYKEVTLMQILYKVYSTVLTKRLEKEVFREEGFIVSKSDRV